MTSIRLIVNKRRWVAAVTMGALALIGSAPAQAGISVRNNEALPTFPEAIDFHLSATGDVEIESASLQFGTGGLMCGQSINRAVPDEFSPGRSIETEWTWSLRETGELPPGTTVWWQWVIEDASGEEFVTPRQEIVFTDNIFGWRNLQSDRLSIFWYAGSRDMPSELLDAGEEALDRLQEVTGVDVRDKIQVYVYASAADMQAATLFAPDWSGGLAFSRYSTVLIGIPPSELEWGKRALAHELSHVVVGHYTFSCVNSLPPWLDEGLAMYTEGDLEPYYAGLLAGAIEADDLQSVRELGTIFSNDPELASLSYAQSTSLVEYLIEDYGQEPMLDLLDEFKAGASEDRALTNVYDMDRDGLEAAWREWAGAAPMQGAQPSEALPTRTPFPTLNPITAPASMPTQVAAAAGQTVTPAVSDVRPSEAQPGVTGRAGTPLSLLLAGACLLMSLVVVGVGWLFIRRMREGGQPPTDGLW